MKNTKKLIQISIPKKVFQLFFLLNFRCLLYTLFLILWTNEYGQPPPTHIEHLPPRKLKDLPTRVAGPAGVDPDPDPASKKKMDAEEADPGPYRPPRKTRNRILPS